MNLRDTPDAASDLVAVPLRMLADVKTPDFGRVSDAVGNVSIPDRLDVDFGDVAGSAAEFAGDVAAVVATQGGRGYSRTVSYVRQNPKITLGALAIVVLVLGFLATRTSKQDDTNFDKIS